MHCKQLHGISDAIEAWHHWSERMGLRESPEKKNFRFVEKPKQQTQDFERHPGWAHSDIEVLEPVLLLLLLFPKPVAGGLQTGPLGRLQKNRLAPLFTAFRRGSLHPAIWQTSFSGRSLIAKSHTSDQDLGDFAGK